MAQRRQDVPSESLRSTAGREMASSAASVLEAESAPRPTAVSSPLKDGLRRFRRNWAAMISGITIIALIVMAIFAPFLHSADPLAQNYDALGIGPTWQHWFGTNGLGQDQYSRVLYGLRVPLIVGIVGTVITVILGAFFGVIAGYFGGVIDQLLARFTDVIFAFPGFTLALIVVSLYGDALNFLGGSGRVVILTIVFAIVGWPGLMRFVRSLALTMKEQQFVEAARTSGSSSWKIMTQHLLPNMYGVILVQASFLVVFFVTTEAVLSILGLGVTPPNPDIGQMLFDGVQNMGTNYWQMIFPTMFLTIIILAFTFFGDGVRDAVDPRGQP
ncbi:MAG: ABC transporter permease [Chloroflexota bacterium]|nr:MAG: diguanylate cyclase [Chloroflexota bacterium]